MGNFLKTKLKTSLLLLATLPVVLICILLFLQKDTTGESAVQIFPVLSEVPITDAYSIDSTKAETVELKQEMEYFFDETEKMSLREVIKNGKFIPSEGQTHWGVRSETCWFRVAVKSTLTETANFYASNLVDHIPVNVEPGQTIQLYYRLKYNDAGMVCTPSITPAEIHIKRMQNHMIYVSIILGIYISLFLYNLLLSIWTKDSAYYNYLLALLFFMLMLLFRQFDIAFGVWDIPSAAFMLPAYFYVLLFTRDFFKTWTMGKYPERIFWIIFAAGIVLLPVNALFHKAGTVLRSAYSIILFFYGFYVALKALRSQHTKAVLYLVSWAPGLFLMLFSAIGELGLISRTAHPVSQFLFSTESGYLAISFQLITLSLALGNRINIQQKAVNTANQDNIKLRELDEQKNRFLVNVSHELRTPLMVITGTLNAIKNGAFGKTSPRMETAIEVMQRNGSKLDVQIRNLLYLSRLNDTTASISLEVIDIAPIFIVTVKDFSSLAVTRDIEYSMKLPEPEAVYPVRCNKNLFELVIVNILSNAFKYTSKDGRICAGITTDDKKNCLINISDTGSGISEEDLKNIFKRFYRGSFTKQHNQEGTGIGLALVKRCMDIMGGIINIESTEGKGTSITLLFPLQKKSELKFPETAPSEKDASVFIEALRPGPNLFNDISTEERQDKTGTPAVLIVEDNPDLLALIKMEMSHFFNIETAPNGKTALELLQSGMNPDIVVTDILMPEMDGITFFHRVRNNYKKDIPFIFLSAIGDEEKKQELLKEGVVDFISKPFPPQQLAQKIKNLLNWKESELTNERNRIKSAIISVIDNDTDKNPLVKNKLEKYSLTKREKEIAEMLVRGMRDKEIALSLGCAVSTVSNTVSRIYKKTGTGSRVELIRQIGNMDSSGGNW